MKGVALRARTGAACPVHSPWLPVQPRGADRSPSVCPLILTVASAYVKEDRIPPVRLGVILKGHTSLSQADAPVVLTVPPQSSLMFLGERGIQVTAVSQSLPQCPSHSGEPCLSTGWVDGGE